MMKVRTAIIFRYRPRSRGLGDHIQISTERLEYHGYSDVKNAYGVTNWPIWLDVLHPNSKILFIEGWKHIFHSEWLEEYFKCSISVKRVCPVCKQQI